MAYAFHRTEQGGYIAEYLARHVTPAASKTAVAGDGAFTLTFSRAMQSAGAGNRDGEAPAFRLAGALPHGTALPVASKESPLPGVAGLNQPPPGSAGAHAALTSGADDPAGWSEDLLTGRITGEQLRSVDNPNALIRARNAALRSPTDAKVLDTITGTTGLLNSELLATREQAEQVRQWLLDAGIEAGDIYEDQPGGGPYQAQWGSESRRMYAIGGMNVGLILQRFAAHGREYAERMMVDEWRCLNGGSQA